jgi:hypothetical protein
MDAKLAAQGHHADVETQSPRVRKSSPVVFALERLFPKRGRAPYATGERVLVLVIIRAMSFDATVNRFNCFLSYPTIVRWSGISLASVKRALRRHTDGPAPLIARSRPGRTRGHRHECYRFTLVTCPERFAGARDGARARNQEQIDAALRDLQPERIALQRRRLEFGGTLTEDEYNSRLRELEKAARRKPPARASLKAPTS